MSDEINYYQNCQQYWLNYGCIQSAGEGEAFSVYKSGVMHPLLNGVVRVADGQSDARTGDVIAGLGGLPSTWWVGPDSGAGVLASLTALGARTLGQMPVMALDLQNLASLPALPEGVSVVELDAGDDLGAWVKGYAPSMGVPDTQIEAMLYAERHRLDKAGELYRFAARFDGRVIGTAELFIHAGVGGIYLVTTDAMFRKIGVGTALTQFACLAARKLGLRSATLQASPLGYPVYERIGFRQVGAYTLLSFP